MEFLRVSADSSYLYSGMQQGALCAFPFLLPLATAKRFFNQPAR
jgi:hypothetical protein